MANANDMTRLLNKIERRLGLTVLLPHLPKELQKAKWADIVREDTLPTFSRYYPHKFKMVVDETTTDKWVEPKSGIVWYYVKDEILLGNKLLGIEDIDWQDHTTANSSLGATSIGGGYYYPSFACPVETFNSITMLQANADMASLYNRGIFIDFEYPNRFCLKGLGNTNYDLTRFVIILLIEHSDLITISPTKMETFEKLAMADVATFLIGELKYFDGFETAYANLDLKLDKLQSEADRRDDVINKLEESYVSTSNDNIPYIWTV